METEMEQLSGLQLLNLLKEGKIAPPSMGVTMGLMPVEFSEGYCKFYATANEKHLNPMGGVHGGFYATVLDTVTGCSIQTMLEAGVNYATIDLNTKMLKATKPGQRLIAESNIIKMSGRIAVSEGTLKDEEGNVYAHGTATCMILR